MGSNEKSIGLVDLVQETQSELVVLHKPSVSIMRPVFRHSSVRCVKSAKCFTCRETKCVCHFTKSQLKKKGKRKCKACMDPSVNETFKRGVCFRCNAFICTGCEREHIHGCSVFPPPIPDMERIECVGLHHTCALCESPCQVKCSSCREHFCNTCILKYQHECQHTEGLLRNSKTALQNDHVIAMDDICQFQFVGQLFKSRFETPCLQNVYDGEVFNKYPKNAINVLYIEDVITSPRGKVALDLLFEGKVESFIHEYNKLSQSVSNVLNNPMRERQLYFTRREIKKGEILYQCSGPHQWVERVACGCIGPKDPSTCFKMMSVLLNSGQAPYTLIELGIKSFLVNRDQVYRFSFHTGVDDQQYIQTSYVDACLCKYILHIIDYCNSEGWIDFVDRCEWGLLTKKTVISTVLAIIVNVRWRILEASSVDVSMIRRKIQNCIAPALRSNAINSKWLRKTISLDNHIGSMLLHTLVH